MYISLYYLHIPIYIERERDINIYIYIYVLPCAAFATPRSVPSEPAAFRGDDNDNVT